MSDFYFPSYSWDQKWKQLKTKDEMLKDGHPKSPTKQQEESNKPQGSTDEPNLPEAGKKAANASILPAEVGKGLHHMEGSHKTRLNGTARKRMKHFLENGLSADEARKLASVPFRMPANPKRKERSEEFSSNPTEKKKQKASSNPVAPKTDKVQQKPVDEGKGSGSTIPQWRSLQRNAISGKRVGFADAQFPNVLQTTDQLKTVQRCIMGKVLDIKGGGVKPKFLDASNMDGSLSYATMNPPNSGCKGLS